MNNHDENKKYFKNTFKVFHAPDNVAKEVLDMAKKLNQEDNSNNFKNNQETMITQAESVSHYSFGRWIAIACACVLIVGSGVYFNSLGSENVTNLIEDDPILLGQSNQVDTIESLIYANFMGMFNPTDDIAISYQYKDENSNTTQNLEKSAISSSDVDLINTAIDLNSCTKIDEDTYLEHNPKYNEILKDINFDSASIQFVDSDKSINIYIVNNIINITYFDVNTATKLYDEYYSIEGSTLLNTIKDILSSTNGDSSIQYSPDVDTSQQVAILFGAVEIPNDATISYIDCTNIELYYDITSNHYITGKEFYGVLNKQVIQKLNELSNKELWEKTDEAPYSASQRIRINEVYDNSNYSGYGCSLDIYDDKIAITQQDGTEEYYIIGDNLAKEMISIIDEYIQPINFIPDNSKLLGLVNINEDTTVNATYFNNYDKSECDSTFTYMDLIKINAISDYNMWQKLNYDPLSQEDFSYTNFISFTNDNNTIEIWDTIIKVTYQDGSTEYYSTMETCGTNTFAQRVSTLVNEKSVPQN